MMRILSVLAIAVTSAVAQGPIVRITNTTHPASNDFHIGDRFEIVISAVAQQPVSVRTTRNGRTDWSPVIALTDMNGRWSTTGRFEKGDFGDWSEVWTVGGKLAAPAIHFSVGAPCLSGGQNMISQISRNRAQTCETPEGRQTFVTPSDAEPFRTPDGRVVPGHAHANKRAEQFRAELIQDFIVGGGEQVLWKYTGTGDEAGNRVLTLIGVNALSENETRKVLSIIQVAFEKPERIPPGSKDLSRTSLLLQQLADSTDQESLKQQIAEAMAHVQAQ
jgi:hypothetical protein